MSVPYNYCPNCEAKVTEGALDCPMCDHTIGLKYCNCDYCKDQKGE